MTTFVILDAELTGLRYVVNDAADASEALVKFDQEIGIDRHGIGVEDEDWKVIPVTAEQLLQVQDWNDEGASPEDVPDFLKV